MQNIKRSQEELENTRILFNRTISSLEKVGGAEESKKYKKIIKKVEDLQKDLKNL